MAKVVYQSTVLYRYECLEGYEFDTYQSNKEGLTCLPSGNWEEESPVCSPIQCPDPPKLANAVTTGDTDLFFFGAKV